MEIIKQGPMNLVIKKIIEVIKFYCI